MSKKLPFTVIGGYLGAGKTTLLNHLLANTTGLRLAVLVNDFGSINIDVNLIRSHAGDTINLANGCMCCSLVNGFATAISQIQQRADQFDQMVIEASGVADPAKIAQYGQMYQMPLDGILVVADAEQVSTQAKNKYVGDTVLRQLAQADLIILNKIDLVMPSQLVSLRSWLAEAAPRTPVFQVVRAQVPSEILLGAGGRHSQTADLLDHEHGDQHGSQHDHSHLFQTWTLEPAHPLSRMALEQFAASLGEDIYRAKGFVHLQDDPEHRYIYQQVGSRWSIEPATAWENERPQTRLVMIGRRGATRPETITAATAGNLPIYS